MAYCGKCGTQLSDGTKFCPKCGAKIYNEENDYEIDDSRLIVTDNNTSRRKLLIVVGVLAAIVISTGLWYYTYNGSDNSNQLSSMAEQEYEPLSAADSNEESEEINLDYNEQADEAAQADGHSEIDIPDWLQGHWVYDIDLSTDNHYRIHVVIEGNRISQYRNNPSESTNPTFVIEDGEIQTQYEAGVMTTYPIDLVKHAIVVEKGRKWMYKLGSDEEIRHRVGFENENTFFIKIANQVFRNKEGKEIRFDSNKNVYIDGVYAGTLSIEELKRTEAIVRYSGGECGEGKLEISTNLMTRNFLFISGPYIDYDQIIN